MLELLRELLGGIVVGTAPGHVSATRRLGRGRPDRHDGDMTETNVRTYTPAEAAAASGFSIDTLRYYEREGLLAPIARTTGGRRTYSGTDLEWLGLVRCLRDTGMPIADLKRYAELCLDTSTMDERLALLQQHDQRVQEQIDLLADQQERLREKIRWYLANGTSPAERERAAGRE